MSSNKRKLTEKEAAILAQQRRVAAKLTNSAAAAEYSMATSKSATSRTANNQTNHKTDPSPPPIPSNKQAALVQIKNQRDQVQKILGRPTTLTTVSKASAAAAVGTTAPSAFQKRPTLKPKTADAVLKAARLRVMDANADVTSSATTTTPSTQLPIQQIARKPNSILSNLITSSISTSLGAPHLEAGSYGQFEPDDFWRNIRDWDFLTQHVKNEARTSQSSKDDEDVDVLHQKKPLPDRFVNHRHYIASWAPLCLAEMRAQLLQEVTSNRTNKFVPVTIETNQKNLGSALDCLIVIVRAKVRSNENFFHANDACLLVPEKHGDAVQKLFTSNQIPPDKSWRKCALIGHTDFQRKSLDGLQLKVSKKWWATIHESESDEWRLLKIGCNITALREFTALCHMDTIPLKKYLLGQHLEGKAASKALSTLTKTQLLNKMGGDDKLGKGFTAYAQHKFNPSQLMAISASASDYGDGGFTLIKGPPGTGKTTTLVAILNSLHIRQFNKYYDDLKRIAGMVSGNRKLAANIAVRAKPRLLVCAPSNAAVDNVILKIMEDGFVDGSGKRYNPSIIRVGVGKSMEVKDVALENQVDAILSEHLDLSKLESSVAGYKMELQMIQNDIIRLRERILALSNATPWPLSKDWEIRIDDTFDSTRRVYFVNHKEKTTTFECPPPPEPGEVQFEASSMPEYRSYMGQVVKLYEKYNSVTNKLERCTITQGALSGGNSIQIRQQLETHILDNVHIVMTTLGTAGNRVLEAAQKFEVVVVDEAAQSVEPSTLAALRLGSKHAILVGDPQQLPATIFNVSGRNTKYDRSLFQRMEEAGHQVFMLNEQYRMHPKISHFPRVIFYGGDLKDGPNVLSPDYGGKLHTKILSAVPAFQPFTVLDLDSKEERGGFSYTNSSEAKFAVHLFCQLRDLTGGLSTATRVAVITPYAQQAALLRRSFQDAMGPHFAQFVEINTVDAFQGREANIVIFSCVRAAGSQGIGFLSDVRRMNVALTRAKHFLLVIARCKSIIVNPYWRDLVEHARKDDAVVEVPISMKGTTPTFPELHNLLVPSICRSSASMKPNDPRNPNKSDPRNDAKRKTPPTSTLPSDPRAKVPPPPPPPPPPPGNSNVRKPLDPRMKLLKSHGTGSVESSAQDPRQKPPYDPRAGRGYKLG